MQVVLVEEGEPDWSTSINAFMLAEGLATLSDEALESDRTPEEVLEWTPFMEEAQEKQIGLWVNGVAAVSDDSEGDAY